MSLLSAIDHIENAEFQSSINVIESVINVNQKALAIIESYEGDDLSVFEVFQESDTTISTEGKKENIFKRMFNAIKAFFQKIFAKFKKNKDNTEEEVKTAEEEVNKVSKFLKTNGSKLGNGAKEKAEECVNKAKESLNTVKQNIKNLDKKDKVKIGSLAIAAVLGFIATAWKFIKDGLKNLTTRKSMKGLSDEQIKHYEKYVDFESGHIKIMYDIKSALKYFEKCEEETAKFAKIFDKKFMSELQELCNVRSTAANTVKEKSGKNVKTLFGDSKLITKINKLNLSAVAKSGAQSFVVEEGLGYKGSVDDEELANIANKITAISGNITNGIDTLQQISEMISKIDASKSEASFKAAVDNIISSIGQIQTLCAEATTYITQEIPKIKNEMKHYTEIMSLKKKERADAGIPVDEEPADTSTEETTTTTSDETPAAESTEKVEKEEAEESTDETEST